MPMNYCTLFNSSYLSRGLALYFSLRKTCDSFHLYIFAFDEETFKLLTLMNLPFATIVSLKEFETPALLRVKPDRTIAEYCWTCTSSIILHCLEKYHLPQVCYLDADLFFWQDPQVLLNEAALASILITEHRYTKAYDICAFSGKYCVQFMYFKNDSFGLEALKWWQGACLEWCYNRVEQGRFGDQKYLDDWLGRFERVKVLEHLGGGVAPWNVQQYEIMDENKILLREKTTHKSFLLIFYHFHGLKFINDKVDFGGYRLASSIKKSIYAPYIKALLHVEQQIKNQISDNWVKSMNLHCQSEVKCTFFDWMRDLKKCLLGIYNLRSLEEFRN